MHAQDHWSGGRIRHLAAQTGNFQARRFAVRATTLTPFAVTKRNSTSTMPMEILLRSSGKLDHTFIRFFGRIPKTKKPVMFQDHPDCLRACVTWIELRT